MTEAKASIRLATTGAAQARTDILSLGEAGDQTAQRIVRGMNAAADASDAAQRRYQQGAAKLAAIMPSTPVQMRVSDAVGTGFGQWEGSAKSAAATLADLLAQEDALDQRAQALRLSIDPLAAAQDRFNATMVEADQLMLAGRLSLDEYTAAEERAQQALAATTAAVERQSAAARLANTMPTVTQSRIDLSVGTGFGEFENSAKASAAALGPLLAAEEQLEARTRSLLAAIDPVTAAQLRANAAVAEARELFDAGRISAEQLAKAEELAANAGETMGHAHQGASVQTMMLRSAMSNTASSLAAGLPLMTILSEQGIEVASAMGMGERGAGGAAAKFAAVMQGPWGFAIQGGIALLAVFAPKLFESADASDVLAQHQASLATMIDQTTGRITEQNKALLLNQAILAQGDAKSAQRDADRNRAALLSHAGSFTAPGVAGTFSSPGASVAQDPPIAAALNLFGKNGDGGALAASLNAIGKADPKLKDKTNELTAMAAAFVEADRKSQQFQAQQRLLTGTAKPGDQRLALGQFGPEKPDLSLVDAEAKLTAATTKQEQAAAQATITRIKAKKAYDDGTISIDKYREMMTTADKAENDAKVHTDRHAASLARQADAMEASARAALDVAAAYLQSGAAGQQAEARRKALTDATSKGIDVDAQVRRQLGLAIGDGVAAGAKSVSQLREETAARTDVDRQVANGTLNIGHSAQAISDEAALRDLTTKQLLAHKLGLTQYYDDLTTVIAAYQKALADAHAEEAHGQALQSLDALRQRAQDASLTGQYAGDQSGGLALAQARLAANREADSRNYSPDDRASVLAQWIAAAKAEQDAQRASTMAQMLQSQKDTNEQTALELTLTQSTAAEHDRMLDRLKTEQQLRAAGVDLASSQAQAVLDGVDAEDRMKAHLQAVTDDWAELKSAGEQFLTDVLNLDSWSDFGALAKKVLSEIEQEFLKLAVLNPLKNLLFGESNSTLSSIFGGIFGSASSVTSAGTDAVYGGTLGGIYASGTEYASGGAALVGEHGSEIVDMPKGARVLNAGDTRRMLAANNNSIGALHIDASIYAPGADSAALARVAEGQQRLERELPARATAAVKDAMDRLVIRR